jgi:hypothetical protein
MASERRVAHFGLACAGLVLASTLIILVQGGADDVVGQERGAQPGGSPAAVHREFEVQQASARALNVAAFGK